MALDVTWGQGWALASVGALLIAVYCYSVVKPTRPGFPRLIASIPALTANVFLPWIFRQEDQVLGVAVIYCITAWLSSFKLLCFCWNTGVLSTPWISSDIYRFVAALSLPIHIQPITTKAVLGELAPGVTKMSVVGWIIDAVQSETWTMLLIRSSLKILVFNHLVKLMANLDAAPLFLMHVVFSCNLFLFVTIVCETLAGVAAAFLEIEILPHFNHPYLATSFQQLWSRRWNLTVSSCLREAVFEPVKFAVLRCTTPRTVTPSLPQNLTRTESASSGKSRMQNGEKRNDQAQNGALHDGAMQNGAMQNGETQNGGLHSNVTGRNSQSKVQGGDASDKAAVEESRVAKLVGMLATFFVSGLAHEMAVWYMSNRVTGEMTLFFTLHGIVSATECYILRRRTGKEGRGRKAMPSAEAGGITSEGNEEQCSAAECDRKQRDSKEADLIKEGKGVRLKLWGRKDVAAWIFVVGSSLVSAHFLFFGPLTRLRLSHEVIREVRTALGHI
ncbi:hypothetical protein CLOM_g12680 [Closterium sp. NIES-68]|nr:hypothetical protein CLOM_g12680 [Closterium sp. NIES-68]GJP82782.1 hypothetical protein CLOP_g13016 [Closterium sp. NIES-67]